jgi:site-specific DNA-methyltransferase (adenine-specific)
MFSFWGDTVLDPFCGTGTTMVAAMKWHRNSIGVEIDREYCRMAARRLMHENSDLFSKADLQFLKLIDGAEHEPQVCEDISMYSVKRVLRAKSA